MSISPVYIGTSMRINFGWLRKEKSSLDDFLVKVSYQYSPSVINIFPEPHSIIDNIGYLMIIIDNIETKCTQNQFLIRDPDPPIPLEVHLLKVVN